MAKMIYLQNRKDHGHVGQTCVCRGEGKGVGWIESLGFIDENSEAYMRVIEVLASCRQGMTRKEIMEKLNL